MPISMNLYTCIESAETISPSNSSASLRDNWVFPTAVGPTRTNKGSLDNPPHPLSTEAPLQLALGITKDRWAAVRTRSEAVGLE